MDNVKRAASCAVAMAVLTVAASRRARAQDVAVGPVTKIVDVNHNFDAPVSMLKKTAGADP